MSIYNNQRSTLLEQSTTFAKILPEHPPATTDAPSVSLSLARNLFATPANNHAQLLIIVGWGDGSIIHHIANDPILRLKQIYICSIPGEEQSLAHSFTRPILPILDQIPHLQLVPIQDGFDAQIFASANFGRHEDIPVLAGADFIDAHPIAEKAENHRRELLPQIYRALEDRPCAYGNDISDSFIGLENAAMNAVTTLAGPLLGDIRGMWGSTPVISIAGGPSLSHWLDSLRSLQNRCILVACDSALEGLLENGIEPHFVTPIERLPGTVEVTQCARGTKCIFAGIGVVPPEALDAFEGRAVHVSCGDKLYDWLTPGVAMRVNSGSSTGVLSFTVSCGIAGGDVYLVGHDLATEGDASHWHGSKYSQEQWRKTKLASGEVTALTGFEPRYIPGNSGNLVPSITWWDRFRGEIGFDASVFNKATGRCVYNTGAAIKKGALIENTTAAPLPSCDDLPILGPIKLPQGNPALLSDWRKRSRQLPQDVSAFRDHLAKIMKQIKATGNRPLETWDLPSIAKQISLTEPVSPGNQDAFSYFLRSALYNSNADMHRMRRVKNYAHSQAIALSTMGHLCDALDHALETLSPRIEELIRVTH